MANKNKRTTPHLEASRLYSCDVLECSPGALTHHLTVKAPKTGQLAENCQNLEMAVYDVMMTHNESYDTSKESVSHKLSFKL